MSSKYIALVQGEQRRTWAAELNVLHHLEDRIMPTYSRRRYRLKVGWGPWMENFLRGERLGLWSRVEEAAKSADPVAGSTHQFYRYPARFSPVFVREVIDLFTLPGDYILDPFVGGGTTIVEAAIRGRKSAGADLNELAHFVCRAKTTKLSLNDITALREWFRDLFARLSIRTQVERPTHVIELGYQKHLQSRATWRLRKLLEIAESSVTALQTVEARQFARCVLLKTGQWALDSRRELPAVRLFREKLQLNFAEMLIQAAWLSSVPNFVEPVLLNRTAIGMESEPLLRELGVPKLVLTSPPYPGVYVTYHRWKVQGRLETAVPYWLAECRDGSGLSFYTMGHRQAKGLKSYWANIRASFTSVRRLCDQDTTVVQVVGFNDPAWQLPEYLEAMHDAGFEEINPDLGSTDGRIWRSVPGRRWYAQYQDSARATSQEVVLIHRPR
ncbi:MAG: hypothetical protein HONBIEJF_01040 [Fimbriimonadaceae bacterium]|nr:hypothetical protein [Fimbriimonadaceae bacterium]